MNHAVLHIAIPHLRRLPHAMLPLVRTSNAPSLLSIVGLATHDLRSLNTRHLLQVCGCRLDLPHSSNFIRRIPWDTNVVLTFEDELEIANFKRAGAAQLRQSARVRNDVVDEFVGELQYGLCDA